MSQQWFKHYLNTPYVHVYVCVFVFPLSPNILNSRFFLWSKTNRIPQGRYQQLISFICLAGFANCCWTFPNFLEASPDFEKIFAGPVLAQAAYHHYLSACVDDFCIVAYQNTAWQNMVVQLTARLPSWKYR